MSPASVVIDQGPDEMEQESGFMNATLQGAGSHVAFSVATSIDVPSEVIEEGQEAIAKYLDETLSAVASQFGGLSFHVMIGPSREGLQQREIMDWRP